MEYGFVQKVQTFGIALHTLWRSAPFWDRPATLAFILQWGWGYFSSLTDMPYIENKKFHPFWRNHYPVNWLTTKSRWINICLRSKPIFVSLNGRKFEAPSCSEVDSAAKMSNCRHFHAPVKVVSLSTNAKSTSVLEIQWMIILRLEEGRSCGNIPSFSF